MYFLKTLLRFIGIKRISTQILILNIILMLSGITAMGIIYNGMNADAGTINMAGRQRMLSQRVAKEVLLVHLGKEQASSVNKTIILFESSMSSLLTGDKKLGISAPTNEIKTQLLKVNEAWGDYVASIQALLVKNSSTNNDHLIGKVHLYAPEILIEMDEAVKMMESESKDNVTANMQLTIGLILLLMLISGVLFFYIRQYLMNPLLPLRDVLKVVANGDLSRKLPEDASGDEMASLYTDYNNARENFSKMLWSVVGSTEELGVASLQLKGVATDNALGMKSQYQEVEMISTAMNQMTATIQEVAGSCSIASEYTARADQDANSGRQVMGEAATTIKDLNHQVQSVGEVIDTLDSDSKKIGSVLDVINGIADQTNLLALNAAIEAARAGESGRGFAVVADEVRSLAARTAESTKEIQQMIEKLQSQAQQAVHAIKNGKQQAVVGVEKVQQADEALERIAEAVISINEMNAHIASASREQSLVAEDMNQRIVSVADASHATLDNALNSERLADNLSIMGEKLRNETKHFRI